jgi:uncharacterized damage-inducible protein DinB
MWERPSVDPGRSAKLCPHLEPAAQLIEVHIYTEGTMDPKQNQTEGEMRKVLLGCCLTAMVAVPVIAQGGSTPQGPPTDPFATYLKGAFKSNANYLVKSAQEFPDDKYTVKLGTQRETRTFAALIGHVIEANYFYCSIAKGEADPQTKDYEKNPGTKAEMATAMQAAIDYCTPIYDALTDANAMEMVTPPAAPGHAPGSPQPRAAILIRDLAHNNEEYGNIVGYFRANNLVPPSSENQNQGGGRRGN